MKAFVFTLAFIIPALLLPAADHNQTALAEELLTIQEAHEVGRANEMWPKVRPDMVKYVAEIGGRASKASSRSAARLEAAGKR